MEFKINENTTCKIPIRLVMINKNGKKIELNPSTCVKGVWVNGKYFSNGWGQLAAKDEK